MSHEGFLPKSLGLNWVKFLELTSTLLTGTNDTMRQVKCYHKGDKDRSGTAHRATQGFWNKTNTTTRGWDGQKREELLCGTRRIVKGRQLPPQILEHLILLPANVHPGRQLRCHQTWIQFWLQAGPVPAAVGIRGSGTSG